LTWARAARLPQVIDGAATHQAPIDGATVGGFAGGVSAATVVMLNLPPKAPVNALWQEPSDLRPLHG
jgi:hypothetical protein